MWSRRALPADGALQSNLRCDHPGGHAGFISTHLAAKTHYVGEHEGGEATRLGLNHATSTLSHGGDYPVGSVRLSTGGFSETSSCWRSLPLLSCAQCFSAEENYGHTKSPPCSSRRQCSSSKRRGSVPYRRRNPR